jgi:hypothetical protein
MMVGLIVSSGYVRSRRLAVCEVWVDVSSERLDWLRRAASVKLSCHAI